MKKRLAADRADLTIAKKPCGWNTEFVADRRRIMIRGAEHMRATSVTTEDQGRRRGLRA